MASVFLEGEGINMALLLFLRLPVLRIFRRELNDPPASMHPAVTATSVASPQPPVRSGNNFAVENSPRFFFLILVVVCF